MVKPEMNLEDAKTREEVLAWLNQKPHGAGNCLGDYSAYRDKALAHMEQITLERAAKAAARLT